MRDTAFRRESLRAADSLTCPAAKWGLCFRPERSFFGGVRFTASHTPSLPLHFIEPHV